MPEPAAPDRAQEILSDLSERAYALACKVQDQAMQAEAPETLGRLAGDFTKVARAVRQVLALKSRFAREAVQAERDDRAAGSEAAKAQVAARHAQVAATVKRLIEERHGAFAAREIYNDARTRLDEEALYDDFLDEAVCDHIDRVCAELGLDTDAPAPNPVERRTRLSPAAQARIDELLSRIPDEADDETDEDETDDDAPAAEAQRPRLEPFPPRSEALAADDWRDSS